MIRHILFVRFTEAAYADPASIERVKAAFLAIPNGIEGVTGVEWGLNDSPEDKNGGFTHCVFMTFADDAARDRYLPHPQHDELKAIFGPTIADILVLDYQVDETAVG